jgi:hypothetical protein
MRPSYFQEIHDAALAPDAWPDALRSLTKVMGVAGAAELLASPEQDRVKDGPAR